MDGLKGGVRLFDEQDTFNRPISITVRCGGHVVECEIQLFHDGFEDFNFKSRFIAWYSIIVIDITRFYFFDLRVVEDADTERLGRHILKLCCM